MSELFSDPWFRGCQAFLEKDEDFRRIEAAFVEHGFLWDVTEARTGRLRRRELELPLVAIRRM